MEKICNHCKLKFKDNSTYNNKTYCSETCRKKASYIRNRELHLKSRLKWKQENIEKVREYDREYSKNYYKNKIKND